MKAEYVVACEATNEAIWLHKFLLELEVIPNGKKAITLYCDNNGTTINSKEPKNHKADKTHGTEVPPLSRDRTTQRCASV